MDDDRINCKVMIGCLVVVPSVISRQTLDSFSKQRSDDYAWRPDKVLWISTCLNPALLYLRAAFVSWCLCGKAKGMRFTK